jgi:hypothetical protein
VLLHDTEELDDNLGGRTDQDLSLSRLLGVVDGIERIVENRSIINELLEKCAEEETTNVLTILADWRFSDRVLRNEVSATAVH